MKENFVSYGKLKKDLKEFYSIPKKFLLITLIFSLYQKRIRFFMKLNKKASHKLSYEKVNS